MSDKAVRMLCRTALACVWAIITHYGNFNEWWDAIVAEEDESHENESD